MAFTDNPLISNMFNAVGLGHLIPGNEPPMMGDPGINPGTSPMAATPVNPGRSKPNIPPYKNRPYIPRNETPGGTRGSRPGGGVSPTEGAAMSQDTLHSPQVQELLGRFGVTNDVNVDPHLFIHSDSLWQNHPHIAGALEGAMSGAAFTKPAQTAGEGISNVFQGVLASQGAHNDHINAQLMAPFQQAQSVAILQKEAQEQDTAKAGIAHNKAMSDYYSGMLEHYKDNDDVKQQLADQKAGYDKQLEDLKRESQDPIKLAGHRYLDAAGRELIKQYGSAEQVPAAAWHKILDGMNSEYFSEKNAWHATAGRGTAKFDPVLKNQIDVLTKQQSVAEQEYRDANTPGKILKDPVSGKQMFYGTKAYSQYLEGLRKKQQDLSDKVMHLSGLQEQNGYTPNPMVPPTSQPNPNDPLNLNQ